MSESIQNILTEEVQELLCPISAQDATGPSLFYEDIYDQIRSMRLFEDDSLPQGVWQRPVKKGDWTTVEALCKKALHDSKDLQIAAWLAEAWFYTKGLTGLQSGIDLIYELCWLYWQDLHPKPREEDFDFRQAPFHWMNDKFSMLIRLYPLTITTQDFSKSYSLRDWTMATELSTLSKKKALQEAPLDLEIFNKRRDITPTLYYQELHSQITYIMHRVEKLQQFIFEKNSIFESIFYTFKSDLKNILNFCEIVFNKRRVPLHSAAVIDESSALSASRQEDSCHNCGTLHFSDIIGQKMENPSLSFSLSSRAQAYALLEEIANYLTKIEPHSPTPLLIRRAVMWGSMSLQDILQELIHHKGDLLKIEELLGVSNKE